jgi:hypothetical protein
LGPDTIPPPPSGATTVPIRLVWSHWHGHGRPGRHLHQYTLADTPKGRAFIAKVRPVVERDNHIGIRIEDDDLITPIGVE